MLDYKVRRNEQRPDDQYLAQIVNGDHVVACLVINGKNDASGWLHLNALAASPRLFRALKSLLACPELNFDDLEPETREAIAQAQSAIARVSE